MGCFRVIKNGTVLILCIILILLCGCKPSSVDCSQHSDTDDNGFCDSCEVCVTVTVDLFSINDLHGKFRDSDDQYGVDELSTYLQMARENNKNSIFLSSGDMWQGAPESNLTYGALITEWMNELDFAAMTLGNHEFDWGEEYIEANASLAEFPLLAINIYEREDGTLADYCTPSVIVELEGVSVGIIGAIGDCYSSISPEQVEDIYFKTGSELTALVKAESTRLRSLGADIIVYSLHDGGSGGSYGGGMGYYDLSLSNGYVDVVFEGHSHQSYMRVDNLGVMHLQGGGDNEGITRASITYNTANGNKKLTDAKVVHSREYASLPDSPVVNTLLDKYKNQIDQSDRVLGNNLYNRTDDALRGIVAKLYCEAGVEKWGDEYDIVLGGGYLSVRSPYYLAPGQVSYGDLYSLFPFDNELVLCSIKGSDLKSRFLQTNNSNYFIHTTEYGKDVQRELDPNGTYYIVVDSYSSSYAPNRLTEVARYGSAVYARDLLATYIENGGLNK